MRTLAVRSAPIGLALWAITSFAVASQLSHFPSPDRPWTSREYVDFYFGHYNGNRALPHLRSAPTEQLFNRLVDETNVKQIVESAASLEEKRTQLAMILATMGEIRAAYAYAVFVGEPLQEELARIQSFMVFLLSLAVQLEGGTGAISAWKTTLWNIVGSLAERKTYSGEQVVSMAYALNRHYKQISIILSPLEKERLRARIGELASAERDPLARKAHHHLLQTLRSE
jgi:hypothetical protein